jgi:hypothetical protein
MKILMKYSVNNPAPRRGGGRKAATAAALVKVAPPPKLPCPTCAPTSPANCWWCVGSAGSARYECGGVTASGGSAAKSGGGGSRVVLCCCLALWAGCHVGWGTVGTCMGWAWLVHGCGELSQLSLHGVGLAGAVSTGMAWPRLRTLR